GGTGVDQHHHRSSVHAVAGGGAEGGVADLDAAAGADDAATLEQVVGDLHGRGQQAARVAAQVDQQAAQAAAAGLAVEAVQGLGEVRGGIDLEAGDAHVAGARLAD